MATGSIIARGDRTWLVRIFMERDPQTGKRLYHAKTIHGSKKDAQRYLNGVNTNRDLGVFATTTDPPVGTLLDSLVLDYATNCKSVMWAELVVRVHLRPFFGSMGASKVGTDEIQKYIAARRQPTIRLLKKGRKRSMPPASNATINRELSMLRRAFNLAKAASPPKVRTVPSIPMLAENNVRKGFFEDADFIAIRRELPDELKPLITFALYSGCRKGEILSLQWPQVDLIERVVRLEPGTTKNGEARTIFMAPELYEVLTIQKEMRDLHFPESPWVFSRAGEPIRHFRDAWETACKAAGLVVRVGEKEKVLRLFHDLRRTGVRNLIRAGVPEVVAMKISGHRTRSVFDRYNIVSESDLRDAARRQGEYVALKRTPVADRHTTGTLEEKVPVN
jgi:integrase